MKNELVFKYNVKIETLDYQGNVIKKSEKHNTVVNDGLTRVRDLIAKTSTTGFNVIGIGTDATAVTNSDTALGGEVTRAVASSVDTATDYQVEYEETFNFGSGESYTIEEVGLFDSATVSGSIMFNRAVGFAHSVDSDNPVKVTITITVSRTA